MHDKTLLFINVNLWGLSISFCCDNILFYMLLSKIARKNINTCEDTLITSFEIDQNDKYYMVCTWVPFFLSLGFDQNMEKGGGGIPPLQNPSLIPECIHT